MEQKNQNQNFSSSQEQPFGFGGQNGDMMSMLLPLLSGGGINQETIFKMLAQNNPRLEGIMQILPMLSKISKPNINQAKAKKDFIKISDYYKK